MTEAPSKTMVGTYVLHDELIIRSTSTTYLDVFAVYEYAHGASLQRLVRDSKTTPPRDVTVRILCDALEGLHCAHEFPVHASYTKGAGETPIDGHVVHRALNLACLHVGVDGVTRMDHFEPVRPWRGHDLRHMLGPLLYASREVIFGDAVVTRTADVHSVGMMLFELLSNSRPYDNELSILQAHTNSEVPLPSNVDPRLASFDTIVRTACSPNPASRYPTALAMARALRQVETPASAEAVGQWVMEKKGKELDALALRIAEIEGASANTVRMP